MNNENNIVATGSSHGKVVILDTIQEDQANEAQETLWHCRLGHLNKRIINDSLKGIYKSTEEHHCEACVLAKSKRKPFKSREHNEEQTEGLIHSDIEGPMQNYTYQQERYFLTVTDNNTRKIFVKLLKYKSDAIQGLKDIITMMNTQGKSKVKILRSDGGGEYKSQEIQDFCRQQGIKQELSTPDSPQQNGMSERVNRTIMDIARAIMFQSNLPNILGRRSENSRVHKK